MNEKRISRNKRWLRIWASVVLAAGLLIISLVLMGNLAQAQGSDPDLGVEKYNMNFWDHGYARPGGQYVYFVYYQNHISPTVVATDTIIVDTLPMSTTYAGDTSDLPHTIGANGTITWYLGDLDPGDDGGFMVTLNVSNTAPTGSAVITSNCLFITSTIAHGDNDPNDNTHCSNPVDVWEGAIDVGIDKWPHPSDPAPGQTFEYTLNWCNHQPSHVGPVWLTDTLPVSTTVVGWYWDGSWWENYWTEVITTGGQFALYAPGLPGNTCQNLHLVLALDPDASINTMLENTIVIATPGDVNMDDNGPHVNTDAHVSHPRYDMSVDKNVNNGVFIPGGWVNYHIHYHNQGNSAIHAWLTDTLPTGAYYLPGNAHWEGGGPPFTPTVTTTDYLMWDLGVIGVDRGRGLDVQLEISNTVSPGTVITNCASVGITETESTPSDNAFCVTNMIYAAGQPNLHVEKWHDWHGDGEIGYNIFFANYGDQTVTNVHLTDTFPISTTSYPWEHGPNVNYHRSVTVTANYTDSQWLFLIEALEPGDSGWIDFNVTLDDPGAPMRWYTNTVEIETPTNDTNPADNVYQDVAFSGGEVRWVDLDVYGTHIWGCAYSGPVTVTTASEERYYGDCWNDDFQSFQPGDVVTVAAGAGVHPVVIEIPDPFDATANSNTDTVWGQIDALDHEEVQVDLYNGPTQNVQTDGSGHFNATFSDIPRGGEGEVRYNTEIDYANITFHRQFQTLDLILDVNYGHDWIEGNYEAGHTVWITVTNNAGDVVKGTAELQTGLVPWWGGQSGFSTSWQGWTTQPDIQPGDWVYGLVDSGQDTQLQVGTITGTVDIDDDSIGGRIYATWFTETLEVQCHEWAGVGAPGKNSTAGPDGDPPYYCQWDPGSEWDVQPGQDIGVWYQGSDLNWVINTFRAPQPRVRVGKSAQGNPGEGGNFVFTIDYWNDGSDQDEAAHVLITDTLLGGMTYITDTSGLPHSGSGSGPIVWDLGTVPGNSWGSFDVFVEITAAENDIITNTVEITTSSPYNTSSAGERYAEWSGTVQANDTQVNVGKWVDGPPPAADTDFTWIVNVCNNGNTASSQLTLTDTLPVSTTLLGWWGQNAGWSEVLSTSDRLMLSYPAIPGWWCGQVYLRFHLDRDAWIGMPISNTAVISAANDLDGNDNTATDWHWVNGPYSNLYVRQGWLQGQLTPGGALYYEVQYGNDGNAPAEDILLTYTLPVSTTFGNAWWHDWSGQQHPLPPDVVTDDYVVWDLGTLENGFNNNLQMRLDVAGDAAPGTVLISTFEITPHPTDYHYDDNRVTWAETLNGSGPNLAVHKQNYGWNGENQLQYEIRIKNRGSERLAPVWITDTYPISTTWDENLWIGHGPWITFTHDAPNRQIILWLQSLDPGESASVGFQVELDGALHGTQGLFFTNTLSAPISGDVYPADNADQVVAYAGPDIYAEKWLRDGEPRPGETVTFTVKFGNANGWGGMDGMYGSYLTETLPTAMTFITATAPWDPNQYWQPITHTASDITWGWWTPWPDSDWYVHVVAEITDTVVAKDVITNTVTFVDDNTSNVDRTPENDVFHLPLTILNPAFEVGKTYASSTVAGMPITYTLTVTNSGNDLATHVILSDTIPTGLSDVSGGTLSPPWIWWQITQIAAGERVTEQLYATLSCATGTVINDEYLVVSSDQGVSSAVGAPVSVDVVAPTFAPAFEQSATEAYPDETLTFTDTSTTDGTGLVAWAWDFGDDSALVATQHATHTYDSLGTFTVTLTLTDGCGYSDSVTGSVTVTSACEELTGVTFTYTPSEPVIGAAVNFSATIAPLDASSPITYVWDFGDGVTSTVQTASTSHTYLVSGTQSVVVTAYNPCTPAGVSATPADIDIAPRRIFLPLVLRGF